MLGDAEGRPARLRAVDLVFYRDKDGRLVEMRPQPYGSENDLQRLLAEHAYLLGGQT